MKRKLKLFITGTRFTKSAKFFDLFLIILLLAINLYFLGFHGTGDVDNWINLIKHIETSDISVLFPGCLSYNCGIFYPLTYPPGHFLIFYIVSGILPVSLIGPFLSFKLTVLFFYLFTLCTVLFFAGTLKSKVKAGSIILLFLTLFSLTLNSQVFGYTDFLFIPFLVLSLAFILRDKFFISGLMFAFSLLQKWQPLIILPVLIIYLIKKKSGLLRYSAGIITGFSWLLVLDPGILGSLIFSINSGALRDPIFSAALNLQWINTIILKSIYPSVFGGFKNGIVEYLDFLHFKKLGFLPEIPKLAFYCLYFFILIKFFKNKIPLLYACFIVFISYFLIASGVHENHLITAVILLFLQYLLNPSLLNQRLLRILDTVNFINLLYFFSFSLDFSFKTFILGKFTGFILSAILSLLFVFLLSDYFGKYNLFFTDGNNGRTERKINKGK